jgi:hypothetical protein
MADEFQTHGSDSGNHSSRQSLTTPGNSKRSSAEVWKVAKRTLGCFGGTRGNTACSQQEGQPGYWIACTTVLGSPNSRLGN